MKRNFVYAVLLIMIAFSQHMQAQLPGPGNIDWQEVWVLYPPSSPDPSNPFFWMYGSRTYTGLAYDKWNDVVYVVNPGTCVSGPNQTNCMRIFAIDANTGAIATRIDPPNAPAGQLFVDPNVVTGGFGEGRYSLFRIDLDDQGRIYAANAVAPLYGSCYPGPPPNCDPAYMNQGPYKVYRWDSPTDNPELIYQTQANEMTQAMWGTSFDVVGKEHLVNGQTVDSTRIYASGGKFYTGFPSYNNNEINCFVADTSASAPTPFRLGLRLVDDTPGSGFAAHGIAATGPWPNSPIWVNANQRQIELHEQVQTTAPFPQTYQLTAPLDSISGMAAGPTGPMRYVYDNVYNRDYLIVADGLPSSSSPGTPNYNTTARVISLQTKPFYENWPPGHTPAIGDKLYNNLTGLDNWITDVDFKIWTNRIPGDSSQGLPYVMLFVQMSNNGIACYRSRNPAFWPVEMKTFTAAIDRDVVLLEWQTASETNNFGFEIQRSVAGASNWEKIGFVDGNGTTTIAQEYSFSDAITSIHKSVGKVAYRLKQVDYDGAYEYSPIVEVLTNVSPDGIALSQNYPNPARGTTRIEYAVPAAGYCSIKLYNMFGMQVASLYEGYPDRGTQSLSLDCSTLPEGVYVYRLVSAGSTVDKTMIVAH